MAKDRSSDAKGPTIEATDIDDKRARAWLRIEGLRSEHRAATLARYFAEMRVDEAKEWASIVAAQRKSAYERGKAEGIEIGAASPCGHEERSAEAIYPPGETWQSLDEGRTWNKKTTHPLDALVVVNEGPGPRLMPNIGKIAERYLGRGGVGSRELLEAYLVEAFALGRHIEERLRRERATPDALRPGLEAIVAKYRDCQGHFVTELVDDLVKLLEGA